MQQERSLATVLFTDIVGSTERAAALRDTAWRELRQQHDQRIRRELKRFGGHEINTAGDSFLATFERPARAIACAGAIRQAVRELGLEIRAGLHMGEVEGTGRQLGGLALHIGARVAAEAGAGEILVSRAVHDTLAGSAFDFEDRGVRALKGVPGEWRLFAVTGITAEAESALPGWWWRTIRRPALWAAAVAGVLLLGVGGLYVTRQEPLPALNPEEVLAADADPGIAVLPFTVHDPALALWREGMVDLLSVNLDGVPDLRAIDNRTVLARWGEAVPDTVSADLATALAVARATGARYALLGTVVAVGTDLRLSADVYEARGGTKLGDAQVVGAPDSILGLVNRLTMEVLRVLPREGSVLADVDLAELTTDSLDALKTFLNGESLYRRADFQGAAAAYERAIASDSTFALAWARLGDACGWQARSELCGQDPPWNPEEYWSRLPLRRAEVQRARGSHRPTEVIAAHRELVRKYPDDPNMWYRLGDRIAHFGGAAVVDRADGYRALERAIALAPTTSAEPYIHLIERALADADSAHVADLLERYERVRQGGDDPDYPFRLAFDLGLGDPATRARARAALDTLSTPRVFSAVMLLLSPRLHEGLEEALRVLLARPDRSPAYFHLFYARGVGSLREMLDSMNDPVYQRDLRARRTYRLYQVGMNLSPEELEPVLAAGASDTTTVTPWSAWVKWYSTYLLVGAYAVDRDQWDQYATALDRQRARAGRWSQSPDDSLDARHHEGAALALEGYALWKRGQKREAIGALEAAQRQILGFEGIDVLPATSLNSVVRWWLGDLMLEVGRPRDAERYFKSLAADPFAALRLGKVYEDLEEFEKARESYEYALLSWRDADPERAPQIETARQGLARLPKPIRRESP